MAEPEETIKDLLVTAGVGTFAAQTDFGIFIGKMPKTPEAVISIIQSGGATANPKWLLDFPSIQVMVRGNSNAYVAAKAKARDVKDALLGIPSQTINGDRLVQINQIGDIVSLGFDDSNRAMFSVNFQLIYEPATGTNRQPL